MIVRGRKVQRSGRYLFFCELYMQVCPQRVVQKVPACLCELPLFYWVITVLFHKGENILVWLINVELKIQDPQDIPLLCQDQLLLLTVYIRILNNIVSFRIVRDASGLHLDTLRDNVPEPFYTLLDFASYEEAGSCDSNGRMAVHTFHHEEPLKEFDCHRTSKLRNLQFISQFPQVPHAACQNLSLLLLRDPMPPARGVLDFLP
mmetsp:Transcript_8573/g.25772  ORF Transcript_8573/g.25772 Transcript_8573/m.25772 type:complete len:204 (+) Transcript_8573:937-1548(+)